MMGGMGGMMAGAAVGMLGGFAAAEVLDEVFDE